MQINFNTLICTVFQTFFYFGSDKANILIRFELEPFYCIMKTICFSFFQVEDTAVPEQKEDSTDANDGICGTIV